MKPSSPKRPLDPEEFLALLREKHWTRADLATHWGLSPARITQIVKDPRRPGHYDDAVRGLPVLRALERKRLKALRSARRATQASRTRLSRSATLRSGVTETDIQWAFDLGEILVAVRTIKDRESEQPIALSGDEGFIVDRMIIERERNYLIQLPGGLRWMNRATIYEWMHETGRLHPLTGDDA